MKLTIGKAVRFRMAHYDHNLEIKEESNEIKRGRITRILKRGVEVEVYEKSDKKKHIYFITHDRIIKSYRKGKQ